MLAIGSLVVMEHGNPFRKEKREGFRVECSFSALVHRNLEEATASKMMSGIREQVFDKGGKYVSFDVDDRGESQAGSEQKHAACC
ncbi:hypothetical protein FH972_015418 [Carpinus fangiana]|uniref:Uncharacterized protein n=1 Tax=Carpinus fangiana TaxID=176857 RepID=A0A5N6RCS1_9ROSI|nr:hypothetical protein FH972_015418 [Carpinus fangiana]